MTVEGLVHPNINLHRFNARIASILKTKMNADYNIVMSELYGNDISRQELKNYLIKIATEGIK